MAPWAIASIVAGVVPVVAATPTLSKRHYTAIRGERVDECWVPVVKVAAEVL